jgi:hypothetical protein
MRLPIDRRDGASGVAAPDRFDLLSPSAIFRRAQWPNDRADRFVLEPARHRAKPLSCETIS